jgi:hypothetical protein
MDEDAVALARAEIVANAAIESSAFATAALRQTPIIPSLADFTWPAGLNPLPNTFGAYKPGVPIMGTLTADVDVLIILDTDVETRAFLEVFTRDNAWTPQRMATWYPYGDPAVGYFSSLAIGATSVTLYKSTLHPKNNGTSLPFLPAISRVIGELAPKLVLETGTAGAIGRGLNCGDVTVCNSARFLLRDTYAGFPGIEQLNNDGDAMTNDVPMDPHFLKYAVSELMPLTLPGLNECYGVFEGRAEFAFLKKNSAPPLLYAQNVLAAPGGQPMAVVSSDYMTVDDANNYEGLQGLGIVTETEDAFASYAVQQLPAAGRPRWLSVRNISDPQITGDSFAPGTPKGTISKQLGSLSGSIFGVYQYCTTLSSAFACWALVAAFNAEKTKTTAHRAGQR